MSARKQKILVWWTIISIIIFGSAYTFLIRLVPLPSPTLDAASVARFYAENSLSIRLGAMICSWTSAFLVPLSVVVAFQLSRLEKGLPVWSALYFAGGILTSIFLVLPPLLWGVAAFTPTRPPEITLVVHEMATLLWVTTTQFFIFYMVALVVVILGSDQDASSPFPRWFAYLTVWVALITEVGAVGFLTKVGPFAWNGLFIFWLPFGVGFAWMFLLAFLLLRDLNRQSDPAFV
ncbi:MAG: hypothetical protein JWQ16_3436 [Novosphingobium sp.]|nr:hypothetical protein [Novosphingobium sp.]